MGNGLGYHGSLVAGPLSLEYHHLGALPYTFLFFSLFLSLFFLGEFPHFFGPENMISTHTKDFCEKLVKFNL
jgi:hypothetical protein